MVEIEYRNIDGGMGRVNDLDGATRDVSTMTQAAPRRGVDDHEDGDAHRILTRRT